VAWLLLPIPYWYRRSRRRGTLIAVAGAAVAVQLIAVTVPNATLTKYYRGLTGADPFYSPQRALDGGRAPFGRDPYRWVPQLSPLVLRADALASLVVEKVTGDPLRVTYAPFLGPRRSVAVGNGQGPAQAPIPDLWWWKRGLAGLLVAGVLAAVAGAVWLRIAMAIRHPTERGLGAWPTPVSAGAPTSDREPVV